MPPDYQPFADDEEDRRRKAEIEEMMRSQRESYFRDAAAFARTGLDLRQILTQICTVPIIWA